jgi:hypothetical protein
MGDFFESVKGVLVAALKIYVVITIFVFLAFGPKPAAMWVVWTGGELKNAADSGKVFVDEVGK